VAIGEDKPGNEPRTRLEKVKRRGGG